MINNINQIKELLVFDSEDEFYHLQILKRKKEHHDLGSNSYVVKTYYIRSIEYLDKKYPEIISLCDFHNARACINLNRRSFERIGFQMLMKITGQLMNKDYKSVRKAYESCCGAYSNESNKKWIIDVDNKDESFVVPLLEELSKLQPEGNKFISKLETKNGYHLIVKPFNVSSFSNLFNGWHSIPYPDVHKDNPTILYIPDYKNYHPKTITDY